MLINDIPEDADYGIMLPEFHPFQARRGPTLAVEQRLPPVIIDGQNQLQQY